jgi:hypothetical protein
MTEKSVMKDIIVQDSGLVLVSINICLFIQLYIYLYVCLFVCLFVCLDLGHAEAYSHTEPDASN